LLLHCCAAPGTAAHPPRTCSISSAACHGLCAHYLGRAFPGCHVKCVCSLDTVFPGCHVKCVHSLGTVFPGCRCSTKEASIALGLVHAPPSYAVSGNLHASTNGAGFDSQGCWALHTVTLSSFVVGKCVCAWVLMRVYICKQRNIDVMQVASGDSEKQACCVHLSCSWHAALTMNDEKQAPKIRQQEACYVHLSYRWRQVTMRPCGARMQS